jgi:WD40 repeat protein
MAKARQVAIHGWETPVEVFDIDTLRSVRTFGPGRKIVHFAASADGRRLACSENNKKFEIHDERGGKLLVLDAGGQQPGVAFSPDSKVVATGTYNTGARLWDDATGKLLRELPAGGNGGLTVVLRPDGKTIAVGNRNDSTRLFDAKSGKLLRVLQPRYTQEIKFSPDGKTLACGYVEGKVRLWDVATGKMLRERETGAEVYTVDWSKRGDVLATAGLFGKILLHDARDLSILRELPAPEWLIKVRFSPDGDLLLTGGGGRLAGADRRVTFWGLER